MRQLWGEVEGADTEVVEEAAYVDAVDDVEAWGSNPPHLKTTITKEARRLPQAHPPKGWEGADAEAADMGAWKIHTKNEIIGTRATVSSSTYQNGTQAKRIHGNASRTIL